MVLNLLMLSGWLVERRFGFLKFRAKQLFAFAFADAVM